MYLSGPSVNFPVILKVAQYQSRVSYLRLKRKIEQERRANQIDVDETIIGPDPLRGEASIASMLAHLKIVFRLSNSQKDRVLHAKFSRTRGYSVLWFVLTCSHCIIAYIVRLGLNPQWLTCSGCEMDILDSWVVVGLLVPSLLLSLASGPSIFWKVPKYDALRVLREAMFSWHIGGFFFTLGSVLYIFDPADAYKRGVFDYKWLILVSIACFAYIQTFHQIYMSRVLRKKMLLGDHMNQEERLDEVLSDKIMRSQLESFLDAELSPEVLRFLYAAQNFKKKFGSESSASSSKRGERIFNEFIASNASMEINISARVKVALQERMSQGEFPLDSFDQAYEEIKRALLFDGFPRFLDRMSRSSTLSSKGEMVSIANLDRNFQEINV